MTLLKLQETYLDYLRKQRRSLTTVSLNRRWLGGFREFCASQGVERLADLTPELLPAYHLHLQGRLHNRRGRRFAPNSLYQMLYTLRTFLRWAFARGYFKLDLGEGVAQVRPTPSICLTPSDLELLYSQADTDAILSLRDAALLAVCYEAELNLDQIHRLNVEEVMLSERQLRVHEAGELYLQAMSERLLEKVGAYLEQGRHQLHPPEGENAVFLNRNGMRLSTYAMKSRLRTMGERAGLQQTVHPRLLARSRQVHREGENLGIATPHAKLDCGLEP